MIDYYKKPETPIILHLIFPVDLWRETVIELECKQHNFRGKKDEK